MTLTLATSAAAGVTGSYLRGALQSLGKQMAKPQRFGKQVGPVIGRESHRVRLLRVLLHRYRKLVARWPLRRRHDANEFFIWPLHQHTKIYVMRQTITKPSVLTSNYRVSPIYFCADILK